MAKPGNEVMNPITEPRVIFRRMAEETGGELVEVESIFQPGKDEPAEHYHPIQEECFEVLEGVLQVRINGEIRYLGAGETLVIPAKVRHGMRCGGDAPTRVLWQTRPALRFEQFFETVFGLAQDGKVGKNGLPNILRIALLMQEFDREYRISKPPRIVQKVLFGLLAPVARLLGYRAVYPYPYEKDRNQMGLVAKQP